MLTREALIDRHARGEALKWMLFWGHTPKIQGHVDASCLSQWFPAPFLADGVTYASAEHFMMAEKARLFRDADALARVLASRTPAEAKAVGREVAGFAGATWNRARLASVVRGNVLKFGQNAALGEFLRTTGPRILVEASPRDRIWGIGMGASNPDAKDPSCWNGENLLGFALMEARRVLFGEATSP